MTVFFILGLSFDTFSYTMAAHTDCCSSLPFHINYIVFLVLLWFIVSNKDFLLELNNVKGLEGVT